MLLMSPGMLEQQLGGQRRCVCGWLGSVEGGLVVGRCWQEMMLLRLACVSRGGLSSLPAVRFHRCLTPSLLLIAPPPTHTTTPQPHRQRRQQHHRRARRRYSPPPRRRRSRRRDSPQCSRCSRRAGGRSDGGGAAVAQAQQLHVGG